MINKKSGQQKKKSKTGSYNHTENIRKRKWYYAAGSIVTAFVVVFTGYMLMLPAITMERDPICGYEEHVHDSTCYTTVSSEETSSGDEIEVVSYGDEPVLTCGMEEHVHTDSCYEESEPETDEDSEEETTEAIEETEIPEEEIAGSVSVVSEEEEFVKSSGVMKKAAKTATENSDDYKVILTDEGDDKTISSMTLSYKCPDAEMTDFAEVTDDVTIHQNDTLELLFDYEKVPISDVKKSNYKIYYLMPDWMQEADDSVTVDLLDSSSLVIGSVTTENGYLVASFDQTWLDSQPNTAQYLKGKISMEATLSVDHVKSPSLTIGSITIHVDYKAGEWEAEYGTIDIKKSDATYIEKDDDCDILRYTLTVSTGDTAMKNVEVKDYFKNVTKDVYTYIKEIADIPTTETVIENTDLLQETSTVDSFTHGKISYTDKTILWNIGDMEANETRTLTYNVILKPEYTGRYNNNAVIFDNCADLSVDGVDRQTATTQFNEQATVVPYKYYMYYTPDDDGIGGTVTYSIKFEASSNNTYTMDNVKVYDYINSSTLPDVSLVSDSMYLYNGDATTADKQAALDKKTGSKTKVTRSEIKYDSGTKYENCTECDSTKGVYSGFICYVGDFAPGVTKTLVYSIKVHDSMYLSSNNHFTLNNRINLFEDDTKNTASKNPTKDDPSRIGGYLVNTTIKYSSWEEKYNGIRQETGSTVDMNDNVYYYDDTASNDKSFDVKMGYYKYRVIINQNGKLDVTAVDLKDTLGNYMQYAGYLRIDEYATLEDETLFDSDYNASDPGELSETIQETAWLKIDGLTSFNFKLKDIGLTGEHAYVLTYYTKITYDGDDLYVSTNNKFDMSGTVTGSGGTYILGGIGVGVTLQAMKSTSFSAEKNAMYYERPSSSDTSEWSKGALYWNIRIVGTDIPENTILKDQVEKSSASNGITDHKLVESDSLVGIYITDNNYTISTVEDLQTNGVLLDSSYYTVSWDVDNNNVSISFPNGYEIPNGKILYILLKTAVTDYPATNNTYIYRNSLWQQIGDKSMQQVGSTIEKSVKAVNTANKAAEQIFTYDGETYTRLGGTSTVNNGEWGNYSIPGNEKSTDKDKQMIKEPGTYIEYEINTCLNGSITGEVEFSDVLPEGLELVYIRNGYFEGMSCDDVEIEELENDPNWTRYKNGDKPFAGSTTGYCISYYNKATREIRWKLANVKGTSGRLNFQLIVKVVDEEVLIGAKTGKYTNSLTVIQNGIVVEKVSSNEVTLKRKALTKEINGSASGYVIPFKIVVNDDGEDLLSNKKEITLVDEMSSSLTIDIPTIKVTDKYGTEVADCKIAMEKEEDKTYLKITIPDDEKIIITYNAKVNVPENTSVAISNVAYWEGYASDPDTEVVNSSFSYSLKAQADISGHASLKLTKRDEEDIMTTLAGAEYSMQKAELQSDGTYKLVGEAHTVTTDKDGVAYFSTDEDNYWMEYNTIYCLTEITAPEGYILDTEPQYILLATKDNKSEYPASVQVQRNSSQYVFEAVDMPKPTYALPSAGGTGTYPIYATGGILLVVSAAGYVYQKKRKK